jgi:hypothetical protein
MRADQDDVFRYSGAVTVWGAGGLGLPILPPLVIINIFVEGCMVSMVPPFCCLRSSLLFIGPGVLQPACVQLQRRSCRLPCSLLATVPYRAIAFYLP